MKSRRSHSGPKMDDVQKKTLSLLSPITPPAPELIVPRTQLPEQLQAEILPSEPVKLFVAGQRGMGKTTELRRFISLLDDSEFLPIFLQFGSQERIDHPSLIKLMWKALQAEQGAGADNRTFERVEEWYAVEETTIIAEEGREGKAGIGGKYLIVEAGGAISSKRAKIEKKAVTEQKTIAQLIELFNACVDRVQRKSGKRLVFVVDDIDKVQDTNSISSTFIHASHFIGSLSCACIFTVPITYATSNYVRIAGLPYNGIHRVPAVDLLDEKGGRNDEAQHFMKRVFELRMPYNPVPSELLERVLDLSGGVLVDAMRMLRGICKRTIINPACTVDDSIVEEQFQQLVDDYQFVIDRRPLWEAVQEVANSRSCRALLADGLLPELLYKMIVIEYHGKKTWFDLHPAARRLYEQNKDLLQSSGKQ